MNCDLVPESSTVSTPSTLAAAMVRAAGDSHGCRWLDPCVGDGAFVVGMTEMGVPGGRIRALDLSPFPSRHDQLARTERGVDFIQWSTSHPCSVDRIVMNPPYVALSKLRGAPLSNALSVPLTGGVRLPLRANYWCAFVLRAISCLRPNGALVAVLPAAWDFAQYASPIRQAVEKAFGAVSILRCTVPLFSTVQDGSVILVGRRCGSEPERVRRIEVSDLDGAIRALDRISTGRTRRRSVVVPTLAASTAAHARLDEIMDVRIGAVTGDSGYFLLTEAERIESGLPRSSVRPVLTRCRQLIAAQMDEAQWARLRDRGERIWLFRPTGAALKHAAVKKYLSEGTRGTCNTSAFKIESRSPWYKTSLPKRIDGFISGMSKNLPFLVLRGMKQLSATNTLYVVTFKNTPRATDRAGIGLALLTSAVRRELSLRARVYADGLLKFEPADLGSVRVPVVLPRPGAVELFKKATALLLSGRRAEAEALADAWVHGRDLAVSRPMTESPQSPAPLAVGM